MVALVSASRAPARGRQQLLRAAARSTTNGRRRSTSARTRGTITASAAASGDPFDFVMETEGLDFKGALESLADRFGVKLETEAEDPRRPLAGAPRTGCTSCSTVPPPITRVICGRSRGRDARASTCSVAG